MRKNINKGFTLVEVILTLAIFSMVIAMVFPLFMVGNKSHAYVVKEFDIQSDIRLVSQKISNYIKKSSATFLHKGIDEVFTSDVFPNSGLVIIDETFINSSSRKTDLQSGMEKYRGWNFALLSADGKELREFSYKEDPDTKEWHYELRRIINSSNNGSNIVYDLQYKKLSSYQDDNLLEFSLIGKAENGLVVAEIKSEVEALNSLQVVDRGSESLPAKVLFYRADERPIAFDAKSAVAMVLDVSGSMDKNMTNSDGTKSKRINILKDKSKNLLQGMHGLNVDISLVPFSDYAYDTWRINSTNKNISKFSSMAEQTDRNELESIINSLSTDKGTNVGDGIRKAYHRFKNYNNLDIPNYQELEENNQIKNRDATKYLILLMDGVPTYGSVYKTGVTSKHTKFKDTFYVTDNISVESNYIYGNDTWTGKWGSSGDLYPNSVEYGYYYKYNTSTKKMVPYSTIQDNLSGFFAGSGTLADNLSKDYVTTTADLFKNIEDIDGNKNTRVYVIGFTDVDAEKKELDFIANQFNGKVKSVTKFSATNDQELENVFTGIRNVILEDFWHVFGPKE